MKVTLRTVLAVALKDGEIALNVATLVDPPRCAKAEMQAYSPSRPVRSWMPSRARGLKRPSPRP